MRLKNAGLAMLLLVLMTTAACSSDTTHPEIISTFPVYGQFDVSRDTRISIGFTKAMNKHSVEQSFTISPSLAGTFAWSGNNMVTFTPSGLLQPATEYTISFAQPVTDTSGNELAGFSIRFSTHAPIVNAYTIQSYDYMPDGSGWVLAANIEGTYQMYFVSSDGKEQRQLNPSDNQQIDVRIAPDGRLVAYVSGINSTLSVFDLTSRTITDFDIELEGNLAAWPVFSPDGKRIAFMSVLGYADAHSDIYQSLWVLESGKLPIEISPPGDTDWLVGFSRDISSVYVLGTYELYNHGRSFRYDVWEIDLISGAQTSLSSGGPISNYLSGHMSPRHKMFVYGSWEPQQLGDSIVASPTHIYTVSLEPFNQTKITSTGRNAYPMFSPDGESIVYVSAQTPLPESWEIYTMRSDGTEKTQLTSSGGRKLHPKWSPDGSEISFIQIEGETHVLYVMSADGARLRRISK